MNQGTPRMRFGGYPETPAAAARMLRRPLNQPPDGQPNAAQRPRNLPPAPENVAAPVPVSQPLIPLTIIDAPAQRFYAFVVVVGLWAWRIYDWLQMHEQDGSPFYYFCKWVFLDFVYLFSLPSLRIPWLELSSQTVVTAFVLHFVFNWTLMFNLPMPWNTWLLGLVRLMYDKELAISEHNVKVSSILHNSSLIMGKQIINILPEGSAILNPEKMSFCLGSGQNIASVPLYFNATVPIEVEFLRFDLNTNVEEVVKLGRKEIREIAKQHQKCTEDDDSPGTYRYDVPLKKPGAYRLNKVLDEYKLEVQRITEPTYIVPCPKARVRTAESTTRCLGDLSNLSLDVEGTPPMKIVYSRTINGKDHSFHFQSLQPDGFSSPLLSSQRMSVIRPGEEDYTWARAQKVVVGLNESMNNAGEWDYSIDEVHDAFGNVIAYVQPDDPDVKPKPKFLTQNFVVRERPRATIDGCDTRNPLRVAKGKSTKFPVKIGRPGKTPDSIAHTLTWQFSPLDTLTKNGEHGDVVELGSFTAKNPEDQPSISAPGLYTLKSVSCDSCEGEIEEPSSCMLLNPLEPTMVLQAEEIPDKCAGNSIGLRVNLDMVGTPPFKVHYDVISDTERTRKESVLIKGLRQQIDLLPRNAGRYRYRFRKLEDAIYNVALPPSEDYYLEQNVKPPASAYFQQRSESISACLDQPVQLDVKLHGDGPFNLEWELVHDGRRKSERAVGISDETFTIETAPLSSGGEYTLALKSIQDQTGCRIFLKEEIKISVRRQRPRASFGLIENKRSTKVVEAASVNLPLRLSGDGPWRVSYRNINGGSGMLTRVARSGNDFIEAKDPGSYEIIDVMDSQCPGTVDPKGSTFDVSWFPRPELSLITTNAIRPGYRDREYIKQDICEGDVDGFDIGLQGSSPFHVQYEIKYKSKSGSTSVGHREFDAALSKASIQMDTAKAGQYIYKFSALSDNLYNHDKRQAAPLTLQQTVNAKPSASFVKPSQTFKLCMAEQEYEERIPIKLEGKAPFYVEVEIKHHTGNFPEVFRVPNIHSNTYDIQIPRQYLKLGAQQIRIRKVRDDNGCQSKTDLNGPVVHVQLYDAPTIHPLEQRADYCVGERLAYSLSGTPPFEVHYDFEGKHMKAKSQTTNFRRIAETPGEFVITGVTDKASECRSAVNLPKSIHPLPSVRISKGRVIQIDIHEGSEVEILFEFWGTAPFEFTYTRSSNARKGQKSRVLETRHDVSYEHSKVITASLEGTYEVVAIRDKYCSFSTMNTEAQAQAQKMLQYQ